MDIETFYEKIGKNIKKIREQRHLTQEALAEKSGISQDFLGKIEVCINRPGLKTIFKLSKALEVEPSELLKFDN
ncbi:MAG: hypothetical protein A2039_01480 [Candidatus Melainabacteria bacterium GWA2_34_9]|nr:MAG: hypothetical protein A2039_01480 [Candidatus Melainabacteria bacterium GWA2_34_9]